MVGVFTVYTDWSVFVRLLLSILLPPKPKLVVARDHDFANSMIQSRSPLKQTLTTTSVPTEPAGVPLTTGQKHSNMVTAYEDLLDVVHFFFMP